MIFNINNVLKLDVKILFLIMFILVFNAALNKKLINKYGPRKYRLPTTA